MTSESLEKTLKEASGDEFFASLEKYVGFQIPSNLKLILSLNSYKTALAISELDVNDFEEMETFMRNDFHEQLVQDENTIKNYLGVYEHRQNKFKFLSGEKKFMSTIAESCRKIYSNQQHQSSTPDKNSTTQNLSVTLPITNPSSVSSDSQLATTKDEVDKHVTMLFKDMRKWVNNQQTLDEAIKQDLIFQFKRSSYKRNSDGSASTLMKCPVRTCGRAYTISYKAYPSYYESKKKPSSTINVTNMKYRWQLSSITKHIQRCHSLTNSSTDDDWSYSHDELTSGINDDSSQSFETSCNDPTDIQRYSFDSLTDSRDGDSNQSFHGSSSSPHDNQSSFTSSDIQSGNDSNSLAESHNINGSGIAMMIVNATPPIKNVDDNVHPLQQQHEPTTKKRRTAKQRINNSYGSGEISPKNALTLRIKGRAKRNIK